MCAIYYHIEGFKFIQEQIVHSGYISNCDIIKWIQVKRICTVKVSQEVIWCKILIIIILQYLHLYISRLIHIIYFNGFLGHKIPICSYDIFLNATIMNYDKNPNLFEEQMINQTFDSYYHLRIIFVSSIIHVLLVHYALTWMLVRIDSYMHIMHAVQYLWSYDYWYKIRSFSY